MLYLFFVIFLFLLLTNIFFTWIPLLVMIIARHMGKQKVADIAECVVWWASISWILPFRAKKNGAIKKSWIAWLLTILSPMTIFVVMSIVTLIFKDRPLPYEKIPFTTRQEIASITEIEDFPEFKYVKNKHYDWDGKTYVYYEFTNQEEARHLIEKIDDLTQTEDNIFWGKVIQKTEMDFYGDSVIYTFHRGWDSLYIPQPKGIEETNTQVVINIGPKGFTLSWDGCWIEDVEESFANPDSIYSITKVRFPKFTYATGEFQDLFVDIAKCVTIKFEEKPSKRLIQELKNNPQWEEGKGGEFYFIKSDSTTIKGYDYTMTINENSRYATLTYETY